MLFIPNALTARLLLGITVCCTSSDAVASVLRPRIEASAAMVLEDRLVLDENDLISASGDTGVNTAINLGLAVRASDKAALSLDYSIDNTEYQTFSEYNLNTRLLHAMGSYRTDSLTLALRGFVADSVLDNADYLDMRGIAPEISFMLGERVYLHGDFGFSEKVFSQNAERNSNNQHIGGRLYFLIEDLQHYLSFLYKHKRENAAVIEFDNNSHEVATSWVRQFSVLDKTIAAAAVLRWESQQYASYTFNADINSNASSDTNAGRHDKVVDASMSLTVDINRYLFLGFEYGYLIHNSSQDAFDYTQHAAGLRVGLKYR